MRRAMVLLASLVFVSLLGLSGGITEWSRDGTYGFASAVVVQNVSDGVATVSVVFQTPCDPTSPDVRMTVPAGTTSVLNVNEASSSPWGASAIVTSDVPVVATQSFLWHDGSGSAQWATHAGGVTAPSTTWYLAEGRTDGGFQSYISVQNPSAQAAEAHVEYMMPGWTEAGPTLTVEAHTTTQVAVSDTVPDVSSLAAVVTSNVPVVAQLSTHWNGGASSASTFGTTEPRTQWFMTGGNTGTYSGFETWITLQNPGPSPATVSVTYLTDGQRVNGPQQIVAPRTVTTFNASESFPDRMDFTTWVSSDQPIVAVQSMNWNGGSGFDPTIGVGEPASSWFFPLTNQSPGGSSWLSLQNVGDETTTVTIDFVTSTGYADGPQLDLEPFEGDSISLPDDVDGQMAYSAVVSSDQPIVATLGTYWQTDSGTHRDLGFGQRAPSSTWYLPSTPFNQSQLGPYGDEGPPWVVKDRDGDGVPDDVDLCPDFPGDESMDGC